MKTKTTGDLSSAESRLAYMQSPKNRRNMMLYEEGCWRFIAPLLPAHSIRILEAGCGTGRWVNRLAPLGHRMVLSDISPDMIRTAMAQIEKQGISKQVDGCHVLDICNMDQLPDESFDMALALGEPIGLCDDPHKGIGELARVVKPGGYVACDVANRYRNALDLARENNWQGAAEALKSGRIQTSTGFPRRCFSPNELCEFYDAYGLRVLHLAAVCPLLSFPPDDSQSAAMENDATYSAAMDIFHQFAQTPEMLGVSTRLLIVGQKP
ncbi:MAG: class I SAM-dependent methyltransferase [Desulfobacterales bacterium]|nr:class I SAM-dependent methyltransferase [Desulfobacterales bacterium]